MLRKLFIITKCDLSQEGKGGLKQENENKMGEGGGEDLQGCLNRIKRYLIFNTLSNKDGNYSTRKRELRKLYS